MGAIIVPLPNPWSGRTKDTDFMLASERGGWDAMGHRVQRTLERLSAQC
jgi:hypothetical protein